MAYYGLQGVSSLEYPECNQLTSIMRFTPFILACAHGNEENVRALLSCKASINTHAKNGHTALHAASLNGHYAVVRLLLSHDRVRINTQTKDTWRQLGSGHHRPVVHKVAVNTRVACGHKALLAASSNGHKAVVELLSDLKGIYVNTLMEGGQTALYAACDNGRTAVVEFLLSRPDITINTQKNDGQTALLVASSKGHESIVKLLISRPDITINTKTKDGLTALFAASNNGHAVAFGTWLST